MSPLEIWRNPGKELIARPCVPLPLPGIPKSRMERQRVLCTTFRPPRQKSSAYQRQTASHLPGIGETNATPSQSRTPDGGSKQQYTNSFRVSQRMRHEISLGTPLSTWPEIIRSREVAPEADTPMGKEMIYGVGLLDSSSIARWSTPSAGLGGPDPRK